MRILLVAVNAKYIHSNLAVYSLKASAGKYESQVELAEYTVNHQIDEIFAGIYGKSPELLLFSCYIWNRREVLELADALRKVLPQTVIWAGGPEVSYDAPAFLLENTQFDGVMEGEGEQTFYRLLQYYVDGSGELSEIPGITYRESACRTERQSIRMQEVHLADGVGRVEGQPCSGDRSEGIVRTGPVRPLSSLDALPFVYSDLSQFENRIIYYESSRGCPFSCSYCLSSVDRNVRFRSIDVVERELAFFLENRVKQVKFVDRTFNCSHERTLRLWRFLRDHDNGITNFHCEISADLLNEEELALLGTLRPGLLQLETGVQTVNREALAAIHRAAPFEKIAAHVRRIAQNRNIHQHLDLIAGLPYEDFESFRSSFDAVYGLHPEELQLGFLKVLKGSEMHRRAGEYGIVYRSSPPYEVLQTKWITCADLLRLKEVEEMLEIYYNSQQFRNTIRAAERLFARPIELFEALVDYYKKEGLTGKSFSRPQRLEILRGFLHWRVDAPCVRDQFDELLLLDLYLRENAKSRPAWAPDPAKDRERRVRFYQEEERTHRYLPELAGMNWKQMMRMTHLEHFSCPSPEMWEQSRDPADSGQGEWILFSYEKRDPLNGDARIRSVELAQM